MNLRQKKILESNLGRKKRAANYRYRVCYRTEGHDRARECEDARGWIIERNPIRRRSKFRKARANGNLFWSPRREVPGKIHNKEHPHRSPLAIRLRRRQVECIVTLSLTAAAGMRKQAGTSDSLSNARANKPVGSRRSQRNLIGLISTRDYLRTPILSRVGREPAWLQTPVAFADTTETQYCKIKAKQTRCEKERDWTTR